MWIRCLHILNLEAQKVELKLLKVSKLVHEHELCKTLQFGGNLIFPLDASRAYDTDNPVNLLRLTHQVVLIRGLVSNNPFGNAKQVETEVSG